MFKDERILLALGGFLLFMVAWGGLAYNHVPDADSFMKFIQGGAATLWSLLLFLMKSDGMYQKPAAPTAPATIKESLAVQPTPLVQPESPEPKS